MNDFTRTIVKYIQLLLICWLMKMSRYIQGKSFAPSYDELDTLETIPLSPPSGTNDEIMKIKDKDEKRSLTLQLCKQQNLIEEANETIVRPVEVGQKTSPSHKRKPTKQRSKTSNVSYANTWVEFCNMIIQYIHSCFFSIRNNSHVMIVQQHSSSPTTTIPRKNRHPPPWTHEDIV